MKTCPYLTTILIIGLIGLAGCAPTNLTIEISAAQMKKSLANYFPLFLPGLDYITVLDVPEINLLKDNVQINTRLVIPGKQAEHPLAEVILNAKPVYNHENMTFYLKAVQLAEIKCVNLDEARKQAALEIINKLLGTRLHEVPVYTLNQHDFKEKLVAYILQDVASAKDKLMMTLAKPGK